MAKDFSVDLCGKHPESEGFDDCWTGEEYETLEEALAVFNAADPILAMAADLEGEAKTRFLNYYQGKTPFLWIHGPGHEGVKELLDAKARKRLEIDDDSEWRQEQATQAGMAFGCEGYNEAMGWD